MNDAAIAATLLVLYAFVDQWVFRYQRVGRGILLLAKDTAAGYPDLFKNIMPNDFYVGVWVGRALWIASAVFAWRAWVWLGLLGVLAYVYLLGSLVDVVSPWPSHGKLLRKIEIRVGKGGAGFEAAVLLPHIGRIKQQMKKGAKFEAVTTGRWIARAGEAGLESSGRAEPESPNPGGA